MFAAASPLAIQHGTYDAGALYDSVLRVTVDGVPRCAATVVTPVRDNSTSLALSTASCFLQTATLKKIIDSLSLAKMNVMHWHATDATSFPLELNGASASQLSKAAYPATCDASSSSCAATQNSTYTRQQIQQLVAYAASRGAH